MVHTQMQIIAVSGAEREAYEWVGMLATKMRYYGLEFFAWDHSKVGKWGITISASREGPDEDKDKIAELAKSWGNAMAAEAKKHLDEYRGIKPADPAPVSTPA
jgi:hypothetical protein